MSQTTIYKSFGINDGSSKMTKTWQTTDCLPQLTFSCSGCLNSESINTTTTYIRPIITLHTANHMSAHSFHQPITCDVSYSQPITCQLTAWINQSHVTSATVSESHVSSLLQSTNHVITQLQLANHMLADCLNQPIKCKHSVRDNHVTLLLWTVELNNRENISKILRHKSWTT